LPNDSIVRPRLKLARDRAHRLSRADLPWLSAVRLPWGLEVRLLNISTSGILVESSSKFTPGSPAEFELRGPGNTVIVAARFVRSEITGVNGLGVKYRAAAVFEQEVDLDGPPATLPDTSSSIRQGLADWLLQMSTGLSRGVGPEALRNRVEQGLCTLVSAQSVQILPEPIAPPDGCEAIYFSTAGADGQRAVLQVTFEPGASPCALDLRVLQAGAAISAVILSQAG
jgi:hypothetical protein